MQSRCVFYIWLTGRCKIASFHLIRKGKTVDWQHQSKRERALSRRVFVERCKRRKIGALGVDSNLTELQLQPVPQKTSMD
jgi:hypothetical protein